MVKPSVSTKKVVEHIEEVKKGLTSADIIEVINISDFDIFLTHGPIRSGETGKATLAELCVHYNVIEKVDD
jgi:hypothetical protein